MHAVYIGSSLFCTSYYLRHGSEIFRDYSLPLDVTVLVWKLGENAKCLQHDFFKVLHPNGKCTAAVKCLSSQNGRIMFGLSCSDKIKYIQQF